MLHNVYNYPGRIDFSDFLYTFAASHYLTCCFALSTVNVD